MKIAMIAVDQLESVAPLARELGRQGHEVTVHTRRESPGKRRSSLGDNVTVDPVPAGPERPLHGPDLLPHLADFGDQLAKRWNRATPDVAHAHGWASGLAALSASRRVTVEPSPDAVAELLAGRQLPLLQSYGTLARRHADVDPDAQARVERALGRAALASTVGCESDRENLVRLGVPRARIAVLPTGVDIEEFTEKGPIAPRGTRSRLLMLSGPTGNALLAVRALSRIPDTELVVAGGPLPGALDDDVATKQLRTLAEDCGVADRVITLGRLPRKQIPKLIRSADAVLALHDSDGQSTTALEAMACGIPVIARNTGGHLDTILDDVTGLLVPQLSPAGLASRVRALLANPMRRQALGVAAADRVRSRYTWDRIARETVGVYTKISS